MASYSVALPSQVELQAQPETQSFAQNAEDVRLLRVLKSVDRGFYVDIGAASPQLGSVTRAFYLRGWCGVNVEPGPVFKELANDRLRDCNLQAAVTLTCGTSEFWVTEPDPGLSTLSPNVHSKIMDRIDSMTPTSVNSHSLACVLGNQYLPDEIQFLKVDVEGAEYDVLASNDWTQYRPIIVIVEAIASWDSEAAYAGWEPVLTSAGYLFAAFDGINRFYVRDTHPELIPALGYPMSPLDHYRQSPGSLDGTESYRPWPSGGRVTAGKHKWVCPSD